MANLFMYTLLFAADLAIIGFVTHYFVKTLHWHMPSYAPQSTAPTLEKLKINGYYLIVPDWCGPRFVRRTYLSIFVDAAPMG